MAFHYEVNTQLPNTPSQFNWSESKAPAVFISLSLSLLANSKYEYWKKLIMIDIIFQLNCGMTQITYCDNKDSIRAH